MNRAVSAYENVLMKRLLRLSRIETYKQDGHGNELSDQALRMVRLCIDATRRELQETAL